MKKTTLLLLLMALVMQAISQEKTLAELKKELDKHPQHDRTRVDKLIELSANFFITLAERKKIMDETLSISQKINYQYGEAYALGHIGYHKYLEGSQEQADSLFRLADSIAQKIGDLDLIAMIMTRLGQRKANQGDKQGMDLLYKAEKIFERSKNYQWLVRCQVNIASVNQVTYSNYPVAMEYLLKAMGSAEKTNSSDAMYSVWSNLGGTYFFYWRL